MQQYIIILLLAIGCACFGQEHFVREDFEGPEKELKQLFTGKRGKLSFIQEQPGDNHCAKVEITNMIKDNQGFEVAASNMSVKLQGLQPNRTYRFSFDARGTAPRFLLHVNEKNGAKLDVKTNTAKTTYLTAMPDWKEYTGSFKTVNGGDCTIFFSLWHSTRYGKMFYTIGDYLLVDNIHVWK